MVAQVDWLIIGTGNAGLATAVDLLNNGKSVALWAHPEHRRQFDHIQASGELVSKGDVEGTFRPVTFTDLGEALASVSVSKKVFICLTGGDAHDTIIQCLLEHQNVVKDYTLVVISAIFFSQKATYSPNFIVRAKRANLWVHRFIDTGVSFYASRMEGQKIFVKGIKNYVLSAPYPTNITQEEKDDLAANYPRTFKWLTDPIQVLLNDCNPIAHVTVTLANISNIENKTQYTHYLDGYTPATVKRMEKLDQERLALAEHLGYKTGNERTLDQLNGMYGGNWKTLLEFAHSPNLPHNRTRGNPPSLDYRYINEDIFIVTYLWVYIAKMFDFPMPSHGAVLQEAKDYTDKTDEELEKVAYDYGLTGLTKEQLKDRMKVTTLAPFLPLLEEQTGKKIELSEMTPIPKSNFLVLTEEPRNTQKVSYIKLT